MRFQNLNFKTGLYRLWLVMSAAYVLLIAALSVGPIWDAVTIAGTRVAEKWPGTPVSSEGPWTKYAATPPTTSSYTIEPPSGTSVPEGGRLQPVFVAILGHLALASCPPLLILAFGNRLIWAVEGFLEPQRARAEANG